MIENSDKRRILWNEIQVMLHEMFKGRELVYPTAQDAASFTVQEAVEVVDVFLRRKNYKRTNPKPFDKRDLEMELAHVFFMLCVTAYLEGINPLEAFQTMFVEYTT
jgi:NTP pyrophosphatase (non-canonical NTP hydrolase)